MRLDMSLGRSALQDGSRAFGLEWLATNGIGGYASGSVAGASTRRYHGLLVAAVRPPAERRVALGRCEETVTHGGATVELAANEYPGAVHPAGHLLLERFDAWPAPTFLYRLPSGARVRKRVWMERGANAVHLEYALEGARAAATIELAPLVCWKDHHEQMRWRDGFPRSALAEGAALTVELAQGAPTLHLVASDGAWAPAGWWHERIQHARERERGMDHEEDLYCPARLRAELRPGQPLTLTASLGAAPPPPRWQEVERRQRALLRQAGEPEGIEAALALAADAFLVDASECPAAPRSTVIAGYPWFTDWGRDTMIALPGLCLATGRLGVAREILLDFSRIVSEGMIPNRFPDRGEAPEFNTVDATLWFLEAARATIDVDPEGAALARDLYPTLREIVEGHLRGTRYGIRVDPEDGLIRAGEPGAQLTWMDVKVGDWVVTPRIGKPVEIAALWYSGLRVMERLASVVGEDPAPYSGLADRAREGFRRRFLRPDGLGLWDVVGDDGSPDASLRPNQIVAASLVHSPLGLDERRRVVDVVQRDLLTPLGLRTLAPSDPAYRPRYAGGVWERDGAYHQGTVWPWLLGPFAEAHWRAYGDAGAARSLFAGLDAHMREAGVGSVSEVFDAEPPHTPGGCLAQAWSVAEPLRVLRMLRKEA
ncbi:MAG TPA: amylo-alpha-1,6-glucosidase [Chthonomonadales bacterium]|nr:amylo-alpha-1,6-glucosidase [Chthonomonadales bacterium]